jgi:hypothetical protein
LFSDKEAPSTPGQGHCRTAARWRRAPAALWPLGPGAGGNGGGGRGRSARAMRHFTGRAAAAAEYTRCFFLRMRRGHIACWPASII